MKCEKCGRDFPNRLHFAINTNICGECFEKSGMMDEQFMESLEEETFEDTLYPDLIEIKRQDKIEKDIKPIKQITEKDKLVEIIKNDKRDYICRAAIDQIKDTDVLLDLLQNEKRVNIRRKLLSVLPENLVPENFKEEKQKIEAQKRKLISEYTKANPKLGFLNWGFSGAFYFGGSGEKLTGQFFGSVGAALFFIGVIKPIFSKTVNPALFFVFLIAAIICFTIGYSQYADEYEKKIKNIRDSAL